MSSCARCGRTGQTRRGLCRNCYERCRRLADWESGLVDAQPVREHINALLATGLSIRRLTELAGVSRKSIQTILHGRADRGTGPSRNLWPETARRLLAVEVEDAAALAADKALVPALGTTRRLQALVANGYPQAELERRVGISSTNSTGLFHGTQRFVTARRARDVAKLFDELALTPGGSARAYNLARKYGWLPPLAWDDDTINSPDAQAAAAQNALTP